MALDVRTLWILLLALFWRSIQCALYDTDISGGILLDPPGRSTFWRENSHSIPFNSTEHQQNCGGIRVQWIKNGGKCGVCGNPWNKPRNHELGGKYFRQMFLNRTYVQNSTIHVTVLAPNNLLGYFEFRIAPYSQENDSISQYSLDKNILRIKGTDITRYRVYRSKYHVIPLQLPENLICNRCLLQWKYHTGRLWGCDNTDMRSCCYGCGRSQEEFYDCTDIVVRPSSSEAQINAQLIKPEKENMYQIWWCLTQCVSEECFLHPCNNISRHQMTRRLSSSTPFPSRLRIFREESEHLNEEMEISQTRRKRSAENLLIRHRRSGECTYRGTGLYFGWSAIDNWCEMNCERGYCPAEICAAICPEPATTTTTTMSTTTTSTTPATTTTTTISSTMTSQSPFTTMLTTPANIDDTPDLVKFLSTAGCSYCNIGNETECQNILCDGYKTTDLNFAGGLKQRLRRLGEMFCDFCGAGDTDCRRLFCGRDFILLDLVIKQRCQYCLTIGDTECAKDASCKKYVIATSAVKTQEALKDEEQSREKRETSTSSVCSAVGLYQHLPDVTYWCQINCPLGYCPESHCQCKEIVPDEVTTTTTTTTVTTQSETTSTPSTTTMPTTTQTTTADSTTPDDGTTRELKYVDLFSANALSSVLCEICQNKRSGDQNTSYKDCIATFCNKTTDLQEPSDPAVSVGNLVSFAVEMHCKTALEYSSSSAARYFCDLHGHMIEHFIVSDLCVTCRTLGGANTCNTKYCDFIPNR